MPNKVQKDAPLYLEFTPISLRSHLPAHKFLLSLMTFRRLVPSFPVQGIDIVNLRLCSSTMISKVACPDVRNLIVNGRASKGQDNAGECCVLEELVKPGFHGRERFGLLLLRFWRAARIHQIHIDTARSLSVCDADEGNETN